MAPVESTVLETAGFGADAFGADVRGFFAAFAVLRLALAVRMGRPFRRAPFYQASAPIATEAGSLAVRSHGEGASGGRIAYDGRLSPARGASTPAGANPIENAVGRQTLR